MRKIKFRTWNGSVIIEDIIPYHYSMYPISQWTGLNDKNGKEIYEGDIMKSESGLNICSVEWGCFTGKLKGWPEGLCDLEMHGWICRNHKKGIVGTLDVSFYSGEIIGNIYQNDYLIQNK